MRLFHSNIDWFRVLVIVSASTASWTSLSSVVPPKYHRWGESALGAITIFVTTMLRPNKWQPRAEEQPASVTLNPSTAEVKVTTADAPPLDQL